MTNQEWQYANDELNRLCGIVKLEIDGYRISICKQLKSDTVFVYFIYVNGEFCGKWLSDGCEIPTKFYCRKAKKLFPKRHIDYMRAAKCFTKAEISEHESKEHISYQPWFGSFASLKKSFIANNTSIQLIN